MTRVVVQHSPSVYGLLGLFEESELTPEICVNDRTFYRAETHDHWVLYKAALSGWGATAPNMFDPRQR